MKNIKWWLLKRELMRNDFVICGYRDSIVRVLGKRFLTQHEVEKVIQWRNKGKIIEAGVFEIKSPHTGAYNAIKYRYAKA